MADLDGSDDVFDSRDVIDRLTEIEAEYSTNLSDDAEFQPTHHIGDEDDRDEYLKLVEFRDEVNSTEWTFGMSFISEDYFKQYAIELASDLSSEVDAVKADSWPFNHIDWDAAAEALKLDYSEVEFMGTTYYHHS